MKVHPKIHKKNLKKKVTDMYKYYIYSRFPVIRTSKGDKNLVRITGVRITEKLNFLPNFQLNLNGIDFSEVIEALWTEGEY